MAVQLSKRKSSHPLRLHGCSCSELTLWHLHQDAISNPYVTPIFPFKVLILGITNIRNPEGRGAISRMCLELNSASREGLRFRVWGLESRVQGVGIGALCAGLRV